MCNINPIIIKHLQAKMVSSIRKKRDMSRFLRMDTL